MALPDKSAPTTPENIDNLQRELTRWISDHPDAASCSFYVRLDNYLGPWKESGYPIGYGQFYCQLFGSNAELQADRAAADWVRRTRILLQELLRDFVIAEFRAGRLGGLTEARLREEAFASHAKAYTDAGLKYVVLVSPRLLPVILTIPGKEFNPTSNSFKATIWQAIVTSANVGWRITSDFVVPSVNIGEEEELDLYRLPEILDRLTRIIQSGKADDIDVLEFIIRHLESRAYPNAELVGKARLAILVARGRIRVVMAAYKTLRDLSPDAAPEIRSLLHALCEAGFYSCFKPTSLMETAPGGLKVPRSVGFSR